MRKFISILIGVFLFAVLVSCRVPEGGTQTSADTNADILPETSVTTAVTSTALSTTSVPVTTTAEEELSYRAALGYLEEGKLEQAYELFLTIKEYRDVDAYLERFAFRYTSEVTYSPRRATTVYYEYDEYGKTLLELYFSSHSGSMSSYTYRYDDKENLIEQTYCQGDFSESVVYEYDENNNPLRKHDWYGVIEIECDANGRVIKITNEDGEEIENTYDENGRRVKRVYRYSVGNLVETYEYDAKGRCVRMTSEYNYSGGGSSVVTWNYDESGKLLKKETVQSNGALRSLAYEYDERGNCIKETQYSSFLDEPYVISWKYDENGNKIEEHGATYSSYYEYDANRNCVKKSVVEKTTSETFVTTYEYDAYGNLLKQTAPGETMSPDDYNVTIYTGYKLYYNPIDKTDWPEDFIVG